MQKGARAEGRYKGTRAHLHMRRVAGLGKTPITSTLRTKSSETLAACLTPLTPTNADCASSSDSDVWNTHSLHAPSSGALGGRRVGEDLDLALDGLVRELAVAVVPAEAHLAVLPVGR